MRWTTSTYNIFKWTKAQNVWILLLYKRQLSILTSYNVFILKNQGKFITTWKGASAWEAKKLPLQDNSETLNICFPVLFSTQRKILEVASQMVLYLNVAETHIFICLARITEKQSQSGKLKLWADFQRFSPQAAPIYAKKSWRHSVSQVVIDWGSHHLDYLSGHRQWEVFKMLKSREIIGINDSICRDIHILIQENVYVPAHSLTKEGNFYLGPLST